jgi:hypothetical protein
MRTSKPFNPSTFLFMEARMKAARVFLVLALCLGFIFVACVSTPSKSVLVASTSATAEATPAVVPATPVEEPVPKAPASSDYFGDSIKIVGIRNASWQGDLYTVPFYTAEIVTPPSAETKNEALVRPTGKVADTTETEFWTPYIASSHPAVKGDLAPGVLVFAMGDAAERSRETLAATVRWALFRVKDVSNLYKGTVTLEYHDTYWNEWKAREYHMNNIRIVEGDFSTGLVE